MAWRRREDEGREKEKKREEEERRIEDETVDVLLEGWTVHGIGANTLEKECRSRLQRGKPGIGMSDKWDQGLCLLLGLSLLDVHWVTRQPSWLLFPCPCLEQPSRLCPSPFPPFPQPFHRPSLSPRLADQCLDCRHIPKMGIQFFHIWIFSSGRRRSYSVDSSLVWGTYEKCVWKTA